MEPLNLVKYSFLKERRSAAFRTEKKKKAIIRIISPIIDQVMQEAGDILKSDINSEFLYKNPFTCKRLSYKPKVYPQSTMTLALSMKDEKGLTEDESTSTSSEQEGLNSWNLIRDFNLQETTERIMYFIQIWELTPATKFVMIPNDKVDIVEGLGRRYYVEAHFSKPTPKCPNPLAVAKVYFYINVSSRLPPHYPIMVTYRFENFKSLYYALGERSIIINRFQRYFIDSILHMKLAFYAELWECRNPMNPIEKRKKSGM